jgi:hypothetical protein
VILFILLGTVYQLLAQGRWFSPGTPASSTTKTGRHDIAEILLKVALKPQKTKSYNYKLYISYLKKMQFQSGSGRGSLSFILVEL